MSVIWYYYYLKIDTDSTSNIQKKVFWVYSVHFVRPQKKQSSCTNHLKSMKVVVACGQAEGSLLTASCLLLGWQMEMSGGRVSWKGAHCPPCIPPPTPRLRSSHKHCIQLGTLDIAKVVLTTQYIGQFTLHPTCWVSEETFSRLLFRTWHKESTVHLAMPQVHTFVSLRLRLFVYTKKSPVSNLKLILDTEAEEAAKSFLHFANSNILILLILCHLMQIIKQIRDNK